MRCHLILLSSFIKNRKKMSRPCQYHQNSNNTQLFLVESRRLQKSKNKLFYIIPTPSRLNYQPQIFLTGSFETNTNSPLPLIPFPSLAPTSNHCLCYNQSYYINIFYTSSMLLNFNYSPINLISLHSLP